MDILDDGTKQHHVTFLIRYVTGTDDTDEDIKVIVPRKAKEVTASKENAFIPQTAFRNIFPYHILFDDNLNVVECGSKLQQLSNSTLHQGIKLDDVIGLVNPRMSVTFHNILRFINAVYMLEVRNPEYKENPAVIISPLILKGMVTQKVSQCTVDLIHSV